MTLKAAKLKVEARLNIDGSQMKKEIHYEKTYAPVCSWNAIRVLLTTLTKQIDYVLAFPQAPIEKEIYMRIPKGLELERGRTIMF